MSGIYLLDDHPLLREGLCGLLEAAGHRVVGQASDAAQALADIPRLQPDVLLLDLMLSNASGLVVLIELQRQVERAAYAMAGGYRAPCQRVEDFLARRPTRRFGEVTPSYRPGVVPADVALCLPAAVSENLRLALPMLGQRLRGFAHPDALLTAPETRSSSPVRLVRDARRQSALPGLYPLGEGAGYAGGIISAAVDGLKAALDA